MKRFSRNFFETSHGRGPQDAAGGYIKRMADLAVVRGQCIIQNAEQLFNFVSDNLTNTKEQSVCSRRVFRYLPTVNRDRPNRYFQAVKQNRKNHQVVNVRDEMVEICNLTCYVCEECISGRYTKCTNKDILGPVQTVRMKSLETISNVTTNTISSDDSFTEETPIYSLISSGVVFAVRTEDESYPYYLVRASSSAIVIRKQLTDAWGASYEPGSSVIHGYYYTTMDDTSMKQTIVKRLRASVPAFSVIYICSELEDSDEICISNSLHRRILKSL